MINGVIRLGKGCSAPVFLVIFFLTVMSPHTYAVESTLIGEGSAGGYSYEVLKDQDRFVWTVRHESHTYMIEEIEENREELESYRSLVNDLGLLWFEIILAGSFLMIVLFVTIIFYKKTKKLPKISGTFIALLAICALYITIDSGLDAYETMVALKEVYFKVTH